MKLTRSTSTSINPLPSLFSIHKFKRLLIVTLILISHFCFAQPNVVTDIDTNPSDATTSSVSQANDMYQSFTPTQDGRLVRIDLIVRANSVGTRQLDVYDGEGTSGSLLHTQSVTSQAGTNEYELSVPIPVTGGQLYTFALTDTDPALLVGSNYSGGKLMVTFNGSPFEFDADFKILLDIGTNTNLSNRGDFTNEDPITFGLETFGTVVGLDLSVFQVTNGTASSLVEDTPGNHILEVTPSGEGLVSVEILEGALIIDGLDSDATMASTTYDITAPTNQDAVFGADDLITAGGQAIYNDAAVTSNVFFAPAGTTDFTIGTTITQGTIFMDCVPQADMCVPGPDECSTDPMSGMMICVPGPDICTPQPDICTNVPVINAPTTAGEYKLFITDAAGNISAPSSATLIVTNETHATTSVITVSDNQLFSGETAEVTFLFLDAVTDFTNDDLSVESGTLSNVISTDGNITFNATFTPNAGVDNTGFAIVIINSQITDGSSAGSGFTLSNTYGVHTLTPAITNIARQTPTDKITGADEVTFRVTFNVAVENSSVEIDDFTLSGTAAADGTLGAPVMVDSKTYDFTVTGLATSNGTIGLDYTGTIHYLEVSNTVSGGDPVDEETFTLRNVILSFDSSPILSVDQGAPYSYPIEVSSNFGEADLNVTATGLPSWLELNNIDTIRTIAGGGDSFDENIPATDASFIQTINDMEYDSEGNLYFIVGSQIKKVDLNGNISTFAGTTQGFSGDGGQASMAQLNQIIGFGIDGNDNFYVADRQNFRIRKIDNTGIITTIAGTGVIGDSGDGGLAVNAEITSVSLLATDNAGNVYFAHDNRIRKIGTDGIISTYAGGGSGDPAGQQATDARLFFSQSLASDENGNIYIGQTRNIYRVDATTNVITNYAGNGTTGFSGDGGTATTASIDTPTGLALDNNGTLFIVDAGNHRIRKVATDGIISIIAGNGNNAFFGDGVDALTAELSGLNTVAVDKTGQVVFPDQGTGLRVVRSIQTNRATLTGTPQQNDVGSNAISLTVSNGVESANQSFTISVANVNDLPELVGAEEVFEATQDAAFDQTVSIRDIDGDLLDIVITASPDWLTAEVEANLFTFTSGGSFSDIAFANDQFYLTDFENNAIFTVDQTGGNLTRIVGAIDGASGFVNVDGDLSAARFNAPFAIDVDESGDLYVIDQQNHALRQISVLNATVNTVVGNGTPGFCEGDCSSTATLNEPNNLLIAPNGDIYISDAGNGVIRLLSDGIISTLKDAGGDNVTFDSPYGLALDDNGILYVTDNGGHTVWSIDGTAATLLAGGPGVLGNIDGSALDARFDEPAGIIVNSDGSLIHIAEATGNIRRLEIRPEGNTVSTLVDNANTPIGLLINPINGSLLYADAGITSVIEAQFSIGLTGTPTNDEVGTHQVSVTLNDGIGAVVEEIITIEVANVNDAPTFTSTPTVSVAERASYTYTLTGTDIDDDDLFFSAVSIPDWLTLTSIGTPTLEGTPAASDIGEHMIVLMVSDGDLNTQQSFTIEVLNVPDVIEVTSGLAQTFGIGDEIQFQVGFDGNINITLGSESPTITLETGEVDRVATYVSGGSNDANLVFSYTVQEGDLSSDLDYSSMSIELGIGTTVTSDNGTTVNLSLPLSGSASSLSGTSAIVVDGVRPTILSEIIATASSINTFFDVNITFSETVDGFDIDDISVINGTASDFSEEGNSYVVQVNPVEDGPVSIQVLADVATDAAGNGNSAAGTISIDYDASLPTVEITSTSDIYNRPFEVTITFDEVVNGFTIDDIVFSADEGAVIDGSVSNFSGSGAVYSATITPSTEGAFEVAVAADVATDNAGNANTAAPLFIIQYDITNPTATITTTSANPASEAFDVLIEVSEGTTGVMAEDLIVENGTASNFGGDEDNGFTATITPTSEGVVTVRIEAEAFSDRAGNGNEASNVLSVLYEADIPVLTVDVNDALASAIKVYPNPVRDRLYLELERTTSAHRIFLYSFSGHIVHTQQVVSNQVEINVSDLPSGIYILLIRGENGDSIRKKVRVE